MIEIKVIDPQTGDSQQIILTSETVAEGGGLIGRHPQCDLVLNNPEVSRVHGRLIYKAGKYYFSDLGSTGGSKVNEEEVQVNQNVLLKPGDVIHIGGFVLLVKTVELNSDNNQPIADAPLPRFATFRKFIVPLLIVLVFLVALSAVITRFSLPVTM